MAGINIPGISDKYKTNDLVTGLMEAERIPLKKAQAEVESYRKQVDALGQVSRQVTDLRESTRSLFSFENPFVNKTAVSRNEGAVTAEAGRNAGTQSFTVDVLNLAGRDRFLSAPVSGETTVEQGRYSYAVGENSLHLDWKGGALKDFVAALNKKGGDWLHADIIGVSKKESVLLLESMKTGKENQLLFADDAVTFAEGIGMIARGAPAVTEGDGAEVSEIADDIASPEAVEKIPEIPFAPLNAVELAGDATMRYQGITVTRPTNSIDDLAAGITLTLHSTTDTSVPITVEQNAEAAKESIVTFVGRYNQVLGELNVLTQNREEVVRELAYLSQPEQDAARERLGMFMGDQTLSSLRNSLISIVTDNYSGVGNGRITMLSNLGISTRADSSGGVASQNLRGYLQIDEKKLDAVLKDNMGEVKNLFGFDSDGDLVIDSGVAFRMEQQIQPYIQRNGILASRSGMINGRITGSETRIARLESQLKDREAQLKEEYGRMEATLNSLESQSNAMDNFSRQGQSR